MLLTPLLFIAYDKLHGRILDHGGETPADEIDEQHEILIAGIGRFGQVVNRLVRNSGFQTTVVDNDLKVVQLMRSFGFKGFFGDPTRPDLLHAAGIDTAKILVAALDDPASTLKLVRYARKTRPDIKIIARARDRVHVFQLHTAGADYIVREMFDSALRAGRYALEEMGIPEYDAHEQEVMFFKMDRAAMRDLAELWDPNIPVEKNAAYIERAKDLNAELETALVSAMQDRNAAKDAAE